MAASGLNRLRDEVLLSMFLSPYCPQNRFI
jgi:hypothetical protein